MPQDHAENLLVLNKTKPISTLNNNNVSVHGLCHTYVTHYYIHHCSDPDFDLPTFSRMIGHASIRTAMEIYTRINTKGA